MSRRLEHRPGGSPRSFAAMIFAAMIFAATMTGTAARADGPPAADDPHHAHHAAMKASSDDAEARPAEVEIPELELVDQDGQTIRFYEDLVADHLVAMNFVFTTCKTVCPPMGAIFGRLQDELRERGDENVQLISVSVDPVTDTPERLEAWSERFGLEPGWTLVTGPKERIDRLLKALEVFTPDFVTHSPTVLVGNAKTGNWQRTYGLAPASRIADLLEEVAAEEEEP